VRADAGAVPFSAAPAFSEESSVFPKLLNLDSRLYINERLLCRLPDGGTLPAPDLWVVDDCVVCQCTGWGLQCARRSGCPRAACVFVDGTVIDAGSFGPLTNCHDCECGADLSRRCVRSLRPGCPVDACQLSAVPDLPARDFRSPVPVGTQRLVSECHPCWCDEQLGLSCYDFCGRGGCPQPDGGLTPIQVRTSESCSDACVCDYSGSLLCCASDGGSRCSECRSDAR
jgi:hypothetical protein